MFPQEHLILGVTELFSVLWATLGNSSDALGRKDTDNSDNVLPPSPYSLFLSLSHTQRERERERERERAFALRAVSS